MNGGDRKARECVVSQKATASSGDAGIESVNGGLQNGLFRSVLANGNAIAIVRSYAAVETAILSEIGIAIETEFGTWMTWVTDGGFYALALSCAAVNLDDGDDV